MRADRAYSRLVRGYGKKNEQKAPVQHAAPGPGLFPQLFRPNRMLAENDQSLVTFQQILQPAITFFQGKVDELSDLPPDSPDRLYVEGILGVLNQYWKDGEEITPAMVKENASLLAGKLREMTSTSDTEREIYMYASRLAEALDDFKIRIGAEAAAAGPAPEGDLPGAPGEAPADPGGEPEAPAEPEVPETTSAEDDNRSLLSKLGI